MVQDNLICPKASIVPILQIKACRSAQEVQQPYTKEEEKEHQAHRNTFSTTMRKKHLTNH
jgi:hypothetical protein